MSISSLLQRWVTSSKNFEKHLMLMEKHQKDLTIYQLTGSKNERINQGICKLIQVFVSHEVNFDETVLVFNVITKKVLPEKYSKEFLEIDDESDKLYNSFINERTVGSKSIWDTMKKKVTNFCK